MKEKRLNITIPMRRTAVKAAPTKTEELAGEEAEVFSAESADGDFSGVETSLEADEEVTGVTETEGVATAEFSAFGTEGD